MCQLFIPPETAMTMKFIIMLYVTLNSVLPALIASPQSLTFLLESHYLNCRARATHFTV